MTTGATQVMWRRGTSSQVSSFIGASGEIVVDYTNNRIIINDGNTLGGWTGALLNDLNNSINNLSGWVNSNSLAALTSGNLIVTGQILYNDIIGLSGVLTSTYSTISNLQSTGQNLYNYVIGGDTNLSGNMTTTGHNLYVLLTNLSGQSNTNYSTVANLASTGQQSYNLIIGGDTNLSGNLTQTGVSLRNLIIGGDTNLTGNLLNTGQSLYNYITGVSGQIGNFNNNISISPQSNNTNSLTLSNKPFYINTYTGLVTWTLPTISSCTGRLYFLKNIGNVINLTGQGTDKIYSTQLVLNYTIYSGESWNIANDGNYWQLI